MASAAYGWFECLTGDAPTPLAALRRALDANPKWFAYDCDYEIERTDGALTVHFTSRSSTDPVWDLLDEWMGSDADVGTWLINCKVRGKGRQDGTGHYVLVKKASGNRALTRQRPTSVGKRLSKRARGQSRWRYWSALLWRVFGVNGFACPKCGAAMALRTVVLPPATLRVLASLGRSARGPP